MWTQSAAAFRAHAEAELRYVSYVQRQPFVNDMALVGPAFKRRLLALAGEAHAANLPTVTQDFLDAAYDNYRYAVRKSIVDLQVRQTPPRPVALPTRIMDGSHGESRRAGNACPKINHTRVVGAPNSYANILLCRLHGESHHERGGGDGAFAQLSRPLDSELLHTQFNVQQVAVKPPVPECGVVVARVEGAGRVVGAVAGGPHSAVSYNGEPFAHVQVSVSFYASRLIASLRVFDSDS